MNEPFDEGFIVRYLLGDLSEQEQVEVENRAFSDADYLQNILAVEADLIDEYARGGLYQDERRQFETRFLASSERRQKVDFAKALARVTGESVATETIRRPAPAVTAKWRHSFIALVRGASPAVRFSFAAASVVFVIGIALLVAQTVKLRGEIAQLQAERQEQQRNRQTLEQQFADERARNQELASGFQREQQQRERNEELIRELEHRRDESEDKPSQPTVLSFVLLPGVSRSGGALEQLTVPRAARLVEFQIGIERGDEYKSFGVELLTEGGQHLWSQKDLSPRSRRAGRVVVLNLPARLLGAGKYELSLKGVTDERKTEDVGFYYFEVLKK